jgi:hypothetical protein
VTLPNLLIAGVPKAGTGSLFAYLAQHPSVCGSSRKEIRYFSPDAPDGRSRPLEWYERFFAHRTDETVTLEATPSYCYMGDRVVQAVRDTLPRARIVMILRDPAERLWSAYTFQRSLGHLPPEVDTFEAYLDACEDACRDQARTVDQGAFKGLSIGMYGAFLPAWDRVFGEDLRVVFFDDLAGDPRGLVIDLMDWLGLDIEPVQDLSFETHNPTVHPRSVALARGASRARTWSKRTLRRAPGLRRRLRAVYTRANAGPPPERPREDTHRLLQERYAGSNGDVAALLRRRGATVLPPWLAEAQASDAEPCSSGDG